MTAAVLSDRLAAAKAQQQKLAQQRERLADLLEQTVAQLHASQGRIDELTELIALEEAPAVG